ncbi:hypothetical protein [Streptomyces luteireticuli]|uniref:hypothetical protein n=1 Tax=Streptomyces luteireticuli TaxID=173858 RepID=UPI003556AA8E
MRKTIQRAAIIAGTVLAAGTLQFATTTSAQASPAGCTSYLAAKGYKVGPKAKAACNLAKGGGMMDPAGDAARMVCSSQLVIIGVKNNVATAACQK